MSLATDFTGGILHAKVRPVQQWKTFSGMLGLVFTGLWIVYEGPKFLTAWEPEQRIVLCALGVFCMLGAFLGLFSFEEIIVDIHGLEIRRMLWKYVRDQNYFENELVRNLRFEQWSGGESGPQSGLRFEYKSQTFTFAVCLGEEGCQELIKRMREVYLFSLQDSTYPAVNS